MVKTNRKVWRDRLDHRESTLLKERYSAFVEDDGRVAHDRLEQHGWNVALFPDSIGIRGMNRLYRAFDSDWPDIRIIEDVQTSSAKCFRLRRGLKPFRASGASGYVGGAVILPENNEFLLVHYVAPTAVHLWVVCAPRELLRQVVGASLETRWIQFQLFAEWGEASDSVSRRTKDFGKWYAPYNGLDDEPTPEMARNVLSQELEQTTVPEHLRGPTEDWIDDGIFEDTVLSERHWVAGPMEGCPTAFRRQLWEWAPKAEWIATAAHDLGVKQAYAIPVDGDAEAAKRVPMSRDGLLAFERDSAEREHLLVDDQQQFAIYGSPARYFLCAGEPEFVRQCLGCPTIETALLVFKIWFERLDRTELFEDVEDPEREIEKYHQILDWCETRWLVHLDDVDQA